jgi:hypothetical protein
MFRNPIVKRVLLFTVIGLIFGALLAEIPFLFFPQMNIATRPAQEILLVIPRGTAQRVALGQQPPSIPQNMSFVVGDTLVVQNEDSVEHQLGPLWIPAGTSASMKLDTNQKYAFQCSFVPSKIFGLTVSESLTWDTRLWGIFIGGVPMAMLFVLYSLLIWPPKKVLTN